MENIKAKLIERGYPKNAAQIVAQKLSTLTDTLKEAANKWLDTAEMPEIAFHGYSTMSLMEHNPEMTYPAALLTLDWLRREPEKARRIIEKGIR